MPTDNIPVLNAELCGGAQVRVWCKYCKEHHYHGRVGVPGHRVALCLEESSPYNETGYYLTLEGTMAESSGTGRKR